MSVSTEMVVPASREAVLALDSQTLYALEQAGEIAREVLDARIIEWTEQGWSQRKIAEEIGCDHSTVSDRQARLGVKSKDPRGGDRFGGLSTKTDDGPDDAEEVWGEVVGEHDSAPVAREARSARKVGQAISALIFDVPREDRVRAFSAIRRALVVHLVREGWSDEQVRKALDVRAGDFPHEERK